ncbi:phosphatase PAP2 family protein [Flavobacterium restrictum]|uniref:Phosphatase PAP2 family protein n=1 Tax=Flavobacterium restrictum TaxID=2594428 RepID=A0A553EBJ9_9FLAO|nr:phosphatase PAP2 family protein [Flavobacterium restrictum]TRX42311.1 phosphatase PAP2 family protein [Flavobacterium restrictum]
MTHLISKNSWFYTITLLLLVAMSCFLCCFSHCDGFMLLNSFHTKALNFFFEIITFFGDGIFLIAVSLLLLFGFKKHRKLAFLILLSYFISGVFAQFFKAFITAPRPSVYFAMHHYTYYLDTFATSRIGFRSFPSGHAASAFAMATVISIYCHKKSVCIAALLFALLVGYSRIYLAHHFLIDVLGGTAIGVLSASLSVIWYNAIQSKISKIVKKSLFHKNNWPNTAFPNSSLSNP